MSMPPDDINDHCVLEHRMFPLLGASLFRHAETDGTAVMIVMLGDREAALPLRSLQNEFGIDNDSPDGRMLALIAAALDFVTCLRIGDPLPAEVLSGKASWEPDQAHLQLASAKLRLQLVGWLNAGSATANADLDPGHLSQLDENPALRQRVQEAFDRAATELGVADRESVVQMVEDLAGELAFIESLRDRLLGRVTTMTAKIERLTRGPRPEGVTVETLTQVRRLITKALREIRRRFEDLDAQTGEVMSVLRNADSQRAFIRSNRDWLYRSLRAWDPILREWDATNDLRGLFSRTYSFLAPRFMSVSEWVSHGKPVAEDKPVRQMVW
jgi:hypothetical protein